MRHRKTVYTVLTCFGLFFTFETVLKFKLITKRSTNKKCRYSTFPSNSQGCFEHPDVWHPCRCFETVLRLKSKWDFFFFFPNLAVNISGVEWSGKEVDMIQFMLTSKDCVGSSVFSLSLPSGFDPTGLILCDTVDCSPPGSSVPGVSQARIREWFAISFFRGSSWPKDRTLISCVGRWILYHCPTSLLKELTCITEPMCGCLRLNH